MTNHIHLILRPSTEEGLQQVLKPPHIRYTQHMNKQKGWKGHLWQGRFFSSALDEPYTYSAIRYVERNLVSDDMVGNAEDYIWSSAVAHIGEVDIFFYRILLTVIVRLKSVSGGSGWHRLRIVNI